jgi:hypothetical protein
VTCSFSPPSHSYFRLSVEKTKNNPTRTFFYATHQRAAAQRSDFARQKAWAIGMGEKETPTRRQGFHQKGTQFFKEAECAF